MWSHVYEQATELPADAIWPVIADVAGWPLVDTNIERLTIAEPPGPGVAFRLKPKGGPDLAFTIGRFEPPRVYSDVCGMPGARMETLHVLEPGQPTRVRVEIRITGPLAHLWGLLVGRRHAGGLPAQTARILQRAREIHAGASAGRGASAATGGAVGPRRPAESPST